VLLLVFFTCESVIPRCRGSCMAVHRHGHGFLYSVDDDDRGFSFPVLLQQLTSAYTVLMKTSGDVHTQQPSVEYGPDQVQFGAPSLWPEPLFRQIELGHAITLTKKKGVHFVISTVKSSILRLSALVILYFHYLKGIFCHSHQNSLLYTQFLRAHSSPISLLYPNYQELDPRVRIIFFLPPSPVTLSFLPPSFSVFPISRRTAPPRLLPYFTNSLTFHYFSPIHYFFKFTLSLILNLYNK